MCEQGIPPTNSIWEFLGRLYDRIKGLPTPAQLDEWRARSAEPVPTISFPKVFIK